MRYLMLLGITFTVGCVSPCHRALDASLAPEGMDEAVPMQFRNHISVTIINGNDPFAGEGLTKLRDSLNQNGFANVSIGGLLFGPYFEAKIRKQHSDDPEARFIIVGYGFGVAMADNMAKRLHADGVPVEAVVAMAPRTLPGLTGTPDQSVRRIEAFAADEPAAGVVLGAVQEICHAIPQDRTIYVASLPLIDDPAPLPDAKYVVQSPPVKKPVAGTLTGQTKDK